MRTQLLAIFCFCSIYLPAQSSIGVRGQVNNLDAPLIQKRDLFSRQFRAAFSAGFSVMAEFPLKKNLFFQAELVFRENKTHYRLKETNPTFHTSKMHYLRLPLLLKYQIPFQKWRFGFTGGASLGYALNARATETLVIGYIQTIESTKLSLDAEGVNRFDFSLMAGIGLDRQLARRLRTVLEFRYDFGLIDIMRGPISTFYNRGFILEMGLIIPLLKESSTNK